MNIRKTIASFAGGIALLALAYAVAQAACIGCLPVGTILACGTGGFGCTATIATSTGQADFTTNATVFPTFAVVGGNPGTGNAPASTSLQPQQWVGNGDSPTLGTVSWQFDPTRTVENTTITADQPGADFPATAHIRFHIRGTIAAYPGVTFESVTPLDVTGTVNSFDPFNNETFTLAAPVQFRDADNHNADAQTFTMTSLTLRLNS